MQVSDEAVQAALARRSDLLADRPDPMVLSEERLTRLMLEAAAPILAEAWGVKRREFPHDVPGFAWANAERTSRAGRRDAERAARALEVLGDRCSDRMRAVAEARIARPEASWNEIGASLGMTKDQAASLFGRLMHRLHVAQLREKEADDGDR